MSGGTGAVVALGIAVAGTPALAQLGAWVTVSHNDPDGIVLPGQTINVRVDVTWTPGSSNQWILFAGLAGDVLPSPSVGTSSNITSVFVPSGLVSLGHASQGGVVGVSVANPPNFGLGGCYPWPPPAQGPSSLAGPFVAFDWTAPLDAPGAVTFAFAASASVPNVRLFPSTTSPAFIEVPTAYVPVTLTVVPGPGTLGLLGLISAVGGRRRRVRGGGYPHVRAG